MTPKKPPFNEFDGRFSPDGRSIAYTSDESGCNEVYVCAFSPPSASGSPIAGAKSPISTTGGSAPLWRDDEKALYYLAADGQLMEVEVTSGAKPSGRQLTKRARRES